MVGWLMGGVSAQAQRSGYEDALVFLSTDVIVRLKPMIKIYDKSSNKLSFLKSPSSDNIDNPFGFTPYDAGNLRGSYGFGE